MSWKQTLGTVSSISGLQFPSYQLFHANETIDLQLTWLQPALSVLTMQTLGFGDSRNGKRLKTNVSKLLFLRQPRVTSLQAGEMNVKLSLKH
jgi:hypothetical protein